MGAEHSQTIRGLYKHEHKKQFLTMMATQDFDRFKAVVTCDRDLMENFRRITHYQEGEFFTSPFDAIGYLKEEVFNSDERTGRVFD